LAQSKKRADQTPHSTDQSLLVKDANVWTEDHFTRASILIQQGKIERIARNINAQNVETIDASGLCALPGLIDVHVHLRDMQLSHKEDFASGTASAAAGGFTTVLDMPNTIPPTDSSQRLIEKQERARGKAYVNVGFHAAATPSQKTTIGMMRAGAFSIKLYMPRPISPFNVQDDVEIRRMMNAAARARVLVTVHAEDFGVVPYKVKPNGFPQLALSRPPILETRAVERLMSIQKQTKCRVHFCHMTIASNIEKIRAGSNLLTSEVTPHHLLRSVNSLRSLGWKAWMVPPLRSEANRRNLLEATCKGSADVIASDHAPHTIKEKKRKPGESPPGVPGLETTLPLTLTLVNRGIMTLSRLVELLARNPARIFSLESKGRLRPGFDGDLVLVNMKKRSRIDSSLFLSKARFSPFDGTPTIGAVESTIVGGSLVYNKGELIGSAGTGEVLRSRYPS
jgi:dihydroorotase